MTRHPGARAPWLALVVALAACRTAPAPVSDFFFIQMSDPQFGMFSADQDFNQETINFERAIAAANRLRPAFVVITGDLVNRAGDSAQIAEFHRVARQLDRSIPLYNVPGNHDVENSPTSSSIAAYRMRFGPDYYTFEERGVYGIVINSTLIKDPNSAPAETAAQESWIRQTVRQAANAGRGNVLVFTHHPWFLSEADEPDQYFNLPREKRREYLDLFRQAGITHLFAGHYHRNAFGRAGELEMVTTGPVGKPLGTDSSGVRIVFVRGKTLEHRYFPLGSIPRRILMH